MSERMTVGKSTLMVATLAFLSATNVCGEVVYFENTDRFDGSDDSRVFVSGDNEDITLVYQCVSDALTPLMVHKFLVGNGSNAVTIRYRIGDQEPSHAFDVPLIADNTISIMNTWEGPLFTSSSSFADTVAIRILDPSTSEQLTTVFDTSGLRAELRKLPCVPSYF